MFCMFSWQTVSLKKHWYNSQFHIIVFSVHYLHYLEIGSKISNTSSGLPRSGKKFWKMKNFPGQGKVRELHFQSGKFKKNEKSHGKVREFQNFPKKILVSIICKQY